MLDLTYLSDYILAALTMWVGYIHKSINERPDRDEMLLRQQLNDIIQKEIKEDIHEIKQDLKVINQKLDQFYE